MPPATLADAVRAAVRAVRPSMPITRIETMEDVLAAARRPEQFNATVLAAFAWIALLLATAGLWALIARAVVRRQREIGIRVALGARGSDIVRMVAGHGVMLASVGIVAGLIGAIPVGKLLQRVLFGVDATDPATLSLTAGAFLLVAAASSLLPCPAGAESRSCRGPAGRVAILERPSRLRVPASAARSSRLSPTATREERKA